MTCRELIEFLMDYQAGALPAAQRTSFEAHLALCPPCVDYLKTYEETVKLGKGACTNPDDALTDQVPEELVQAILAARAKQ
jgi:anti-sigma factor RsiW